MNGSRLAATPGMSRDASGPPRAGSVTVDWVIQCQPATPRGRLACFPYAGGGASLYRRWAEALAADVELVALQLPGRENRVMDEPLVDLVQAATLAVDALRALPPLPTVFFGHSMGALLAYEAALRLPDSPPVALAVSGRSAPHLGARVQPVAEMSDAVFIDYLRGIGGTSEEVLEQPELMALLLPMLRADFRMVDDYRPSNPPAVLACPVLAFYGTEDAATPPQRMQAWQLTAAGPFELHALPGGHFFLEPQKRRILQILGLDQGVDQLAPRAASRFATSRST